MRCHAMREGEEAQAPSPLFSRTGSLHPPPKRAGTRTSFFQFLDGEDFAVRCFCRLNERQGA